MMIQTPDQNMLHFGISLLTVTQPLKPRKKAIPFPVHFQNYLIQILNQMQSAYDFT